MKLTKISIKKIEGKEKLIGIADVVIDGCFAIHGIKIVDGKQGMFLSFPSKKLPNGEFVDICHPINQEIRDMFTAEVIKEYNALDDSNKEA